MFWENLYILLSFNTKYGYIIAYIKTIFAKYKIKFY